MKGTYIEVIERFKAGLKEGLTILYENYGKPLYQFSATNWGLDEDECYDILYKTLESVGKVIERYEFSSESHFKNWLFKIHKNNILQSVRSRKGKELLVFEFNDWVNEIKTYDDEAFDISGYEPFIETIKGENPHDDEGQNSQLFFAMQKALACISESEKELLLLRMNNYSYDEIAEMLAIQNKQLKVKFIRAKAKVQKKTLEILKESSNEN
ncbi:RNA polymerase sigma factor [Mucilaginibacter flavidus]|uniref:RNA polymerase sigma factor n=1 Tax=Mucilaginibacter flavidus TaxID=2949309 RepID=UPI002094029B|nr:sigma-70 family RNA polymerase sigma factor [Mucilaginibacter flavidus]MCO5950525.1 sigma-70 family RNA polymerase sigma factor [Mucilaginibacter flavidus]